MPKAQPSATASRPERRNAVVFWMSLGALGAAWLFGFSLRAPIWSESIENVRRSGVSTIFGEIVSVKVNGVPQRFQGSASDLVEIALLLAVATAGYLGCLWALHRGIPRPFASAIAASVVAVACVVPVTPLTSPDAMHFAADVRTFWLHGFKNPTVRANAPGRVDDPVAKQVVTYANAPSGYGRLSYVVGGAALPFVGDNVRANVFGVKAVSAAFFLAIVALTGLLARQLGRSPGLYAAMVGLNPLLLWEFPADGHNDTIMVALAMLAFLLATRERWTQRGWSIAAGILSVAAKYAMAVAAPVVLAWWFPRARYVIAGLMALAGIGAAIVILAGLQGRNGATGPATGLTDNSPWQLMVNAADGTQVDRLFAVSYVLLGALGAAIIARHPLKTAGDAVAAAGLLLFGFLFVCSPSLRHWYQLWAFPLAILTGRRWLTAAALAFSTGAFLTILATNWRLAIDFQMGIRNPVDKSVVVLWLLTAGVGMLAWWQDRGRRLRIEEAAARQAQRGPQRRARGRA